MTPDRTLTGEALRLLSEVRHDPGTAWTKAARLAHILRASILFRQCARGRGVAALGTVRLERPERMTFGNRVTFLGGMIPTHLVCAPDGRLVIGDDVVLNYGVFLEAHGTLQIGNRCMLASSVRITDRAFAGGASDVTLGSDVWVAHGAIIEPGVTIGQGSVVSAGSVVTRNVPANSLAIGNPARSMSLDLFA